MIKTLPALAVIAGISALSLHAAPPESVQQNWTKHCLSCHGKDGKGKTKAGRQAKVKDLTDAKYQETFDDTKAFTVLKEGLKIDGKEAMKPFRDKLSDQEIKDLVAFVRTLKE